jgi:hypothetical protein
MVRFAGWLREARAEVYTVVDATQIAMVNLFSYYCLYSPSTTLQTSVIEGQLGGI